MTLFKQVIEATDPTQIRKLVDKIFMAFDADDNFSWTFDEVSDMISQYLNYLATYKGQLRPSPERVLIMARVEFNKMDTDSDGVITKDEFLQYVIK